MSPLEQAAIAFVRAEEAWSAACDMYRGHVGRQDLERRTKEERAWWDEHVAPAMEPTWPARSRLFAVARAATAPPREFDEAFWPISEVRS